MTSPPDFDFRKHVRDIPDFPKPGILFRDLTPLFGNAEALRAAVDVLAHPFRDDRIECVLGIESRGFILGPAVALDLGTGFGLIRKAGKLPYRILQVRYELEYGTDTVEMHVDTVQPGQRVLIVDDLLATGGTAAAAVRLVRAAEGEVVACAFLVELGALEGRKQLAIDRVHSVIEY